MALKNFDQIVEQAKSVQKPKTVVIAGADAENILLGAFMAQEAGFVFPVLVGEEEKVVPMLERLGMKDRPYRLVPTQPGENVVFEEITMGCVCGRPALIFVADHLPAEDIVSQRHIPTSIHWRCRFRKATHGKPACLSIRLCR